ncbi:MAG: GerMN domain-containing protein [Bacillota bacterium]
MWRMAIAIVLCLVLLVGAVGCAPEQEAAMSEQEDTDAGFRKTVLYYRSDEGFVVPVMRMIPWEEGIGRAAVSYLIGTEENQKSVAPMGLNTVLPDGVSVELRIKDGLATLNIINLSEYPDAVSEQAMVDAVVSTLLEFPSIDSVQLKFDGKLKNKLPNGTLVGEPITGVALNGEQEDIDTSADGSYNKLTLYFPNQSCSLNVPVTRYVQNIRTFETAVGELIKGPAIDGLRNCFPEGTELLSCSIEDTKASVDLSKEFLSVSDTPGLAPAAYEALCLTAMQFGPIEELSLTVEGKAFDFGSERANLPVFANEFDS